MLAKLWKKVLMLILIIACLFNVVIKLVKHLSFEKELLSSAQYIQDMQDAEAAKKEEAKEEEKKTEHNTTKRTENSTKNTTNQTNTNKTTKQDNVVIVK